MSSNYSNIPALSRENYEEYFLLYIDNELSPEAREAVEAFALLHPDLQAELELLSDTRLEPLPFTFDKSALLAEAMQEQNPDEQLFLYIDNELTEAQKAAVEEKAAAQPRFAAQLESLRRTKLEADPSIVFPDKSVLYRREEKTRRLAPWFRYAAAAVLAVGSVTALWLNNEDPAAGTTTTVAVFNPLPEQPAAVPAIPKQTTTTLPAPAENGSAPEKENREVLASNRPAQRSAAQPLERRRPAAPVADPRPAAGHNGEGSVAGQTVTVPQPQHVEAATAPAIPADVATAQVTPSQQNINREPVTNTAPDRITYTSAQEEGTGPAFAAAPAAKNKTSVRGLLRKATRFIERTTSIDPTNGGDELLLGAVAIKLK
ncbi:MAG TPA: hypothetical protein VHK69_15150 [Chitinophagaceae bacterium]|jgi:hypothetical protein|nr:hypothetical protein [Chitinophagaceae bacterium]